MISRAPLPSLVLISGLSGSGKSTALKGLEDMGWYCVDNLPVPLLPALVEELTREGRRCIAVAVDGRSGELSQLAPMTAAARLRCHSVRMIFLEASDEVLIARYGETRRRHPLAGLNQSLIEAINQERGLLQEISFQAQRIDTSRLTSLSLVSEMQRILAQPATAMVLQLMSFAYRDGVPRDADLVFDARCLPNPFYETGLRYLDGRHPDIHRYFQQCPEVMQFIQDLLHFFRTWLPAYHRSQRASLTLAIGCTGGRHRSVYLVEQLASLLPSDNRKILVRHRSLEERAKGGAA